MASAESAAGVPETISVAETALPAMQGAMDRRLLDELWRSSDVPSWGLERDEFDRIIADAGIAQNFGLDAGVAATRRQQAEFFRGLRLDDLVLARACAAGNERAWEHFIAQHRQPLIRAAIAITGSETLGRDLADQLYAELFGLNMREGERRCPLLSYRGRGSLMGWLRTTLAQRHVDHHRRSRREHAARRDRCRRRQMRRRRRPAPSFRSWSAPSNMRLRSGMLKNASCWRHIILTGKPCCRLRASSECTKPR